MDVCSYSDIQALKQHTTVSQALKQHTTVSLLSLSVGSFLSF
jgi:uncharacterized protein YerC